MSADPPIVLITPQARATLEAEASRGSPTGELTGGLLFGCPLDVDQRLIVSSTRLSADTGFGRRDFSLARARTSQQRKQAARLHPQATYCGVWYLHHTPNQALTSEEWTQTQTTLEDPDFGFDDLVCLVLCSYNKLTFHATSFDRHHSTSGRAPTPTQLRLTTERDPSTAVSQGAPPAPDSPVDWIKAPEVAARLSQEHEWLAEKYHVQPAMSTDGQMFFRLYPKQRYEKLVFYLACSKGFPERAPSAFLLAGGAPYPLSTPGLGNWSSNKKLVQVADELVQWMAFSLDTYMQDGEAALKQGEYQRAADLLAIVLTIEPRTPRAARLLAQAQAPLR